MDEGFSQNKNGRDQHEFNNAWSYLTRINIFMWQCRDAAQTLDGNMWLQSLTSIMVEIAADMKPEELDKTMKTLKELFEQINDNSTRNRRVQSGGIEPEMFWKLVNVELGLRQVMKETGMLSKMKDDPFNSLR